MSGSRESGRESRRSAAGLDCSAIRQHRLTSSFRPVSSARNSPTLSCTTSLLPRHTLPLTYSLTHPQNASSTLKFGLQAGRLTNRRFRTRVSRYDRISGPLLSLPMARAGALSHIASSRPPPLSRNRSRRATEPSLLLFPPVPSIAPRWSPGKLPNSSWPSHRA